MKPTLLIFTCLAVAGTAVRATVIMVDDTHSQSFNSAYLSLRLSAQQPNQFYGPGTLAENGGLSIGEGNYHFAVLGFSLGVSNQISNNYTMGVGLGNIVGTQYGMAFGTWNTIQGYSRAALAVGSWNNVRMYDSMVIGDHNQASGTTSVRAQNSLIVGSYNSVYENTDSAFVAGTNNAIDAASAFVLGTGNVASYDNCTIVGMYNNELDPYADEAVFVVGNGYDGGGGNITRRTALTVTNDGAVIIHDPSSEIPMF